MEDISKNTLQAQRTYSASKNFSMGLIEQQTIPYLKIDNKRVFVCISIDIHFTCSPYYITPF